MRALQDTVDAAAERTGFSGVVRLDRAGETELSAAYGFADRAHEIRNTVQTQFATASGAKGLTALTVMSLIERGAFELGTTARSLLGGDLPLIADGVTIEQLLAHRSGIGDYLDEDTLDDIGDYVLPVPVHELTATEQFLPILDGHETTYAAGERFAYNNGGYVVLALLAERATGVDFHELARTLVCQPAGMADTAFLRTDELPGRAALGYLSVAGLRTNMFHLPVVGNGDGGIYSTAADFNSFWDALFAGRNRLRGTGGRDGATAQRLAGGVQALRPRVPPPPNRRRSLVEGYDAGVSFSSLHQPSSSITYTVISNWSEGAWPIIELLDDQLGT